MSNQNSQLNAQEVAIADSTGSIVAVFPSPPAGMINVGSLTVPAAPPGALFSAAVGGLPTLSWAGQSTGGPVQSGVPVTVTGLGLIPGTSYQVNYLGRTVSASQIGNAPAPINFSTTGIQSQSQLILTHTGNYNDHLPIAPTYRSLRIHSGTGIGTISVSGDKTGTIYYQSSDGITELDYVDIPIDGSVDSSVYVQVGATSGTWWVTAQLSDVTVDVTTPSDQPLPVEVHYTGSDTGVQVVNPFNSSGQQLPLSVVTMGGFVHLASGDIASGATWDALPAPASNMMYRLHRIIATGPLLTAPNGPTIINTDSPAVVIGGLTSGSYVGNMFGLITAQSVSVLNASNETLNYTLCYDTVTRALIG